MLGYTTFAQMSLFFTLVGLLNAFLMWPLVLLLYFTGAETIIWTQIPWLTLSGAAALSLMANILGNFGLVWTYEVFLTLGLFFAIPISAGLCHIPLYRICRDSLLVFNVVKFLTLKFFKIPSHLESHVRMRPYFYPTHFYYDNFVVSYRRYFKKNHIPLHPVPEFLGNPIIIKLKNLKSI